MTRKREDRPGADGFVPESGDLGELARAVQDCRGCELYRDATQAVFGSGSARAGLVLLGEQPGDVEDQRGEPFVGPAGRLLRRALGEAGVDESDTYLTNAVKHFRWRPDPRGGKRRIHQRPDTGQIAACRPWLHAEARLLRPRVLVTLGATAGEALFGGMFRVGVQRGRVLTWTPPDEPADGRTANGGGGETQEIQVVPTIHPSAILRDPERDEAFGLLVEDLRRAAGLLAGHGAPSAHRGAAR